MFWEVGPLLSKGHWKKGESFESPLLKTKDNTLWWLDFFPAGDDGTTDSLVFWLNRSNAEKQTIITFQIQFCFHTTPARVYTLNHAFEKGEDVHKWVIDDVKNFAQLKVFIPPPALCLIGFLRVKEAD